MLFHSNAALVSGNYVGDIFFVISGYLIKCILLGEFHGSGLDDNLGARRFARATMKKETRSSCPTKHRGCEVRLKNLNWANLSAGPSFECLV